MQQQNINKLISLSFDENPEVRKHAAKLLGELDDPGAAFALVELSFDKDPAVRVVAQQYLDKRRYSEPELMSFANIFSSGAKKQPAEEKEAVPSDPKEKVLRPITQIFEKRLGKEKAEAVKSKMMPSIEKIYNTVHPAGGKKKTGENGRKAMQEFLTSYLEVMSDLEQIGGGTLQPVQQTGLMEQIPAETIEHAQMETKIETELEEVGRQTKLNAVSSEIANIEMTEVAELKEEEEIEKLPDTFFKKAYETMMLSGGDEDIMRREMKRMVDDANREITLAFRFAKKKFKETKITNITKIKDGMRNINTDPLTVKSAENMQYKKTKTQTAVLTRIVVNDDDGDEGVIYLFDGRGAEIKPQMKIKVVKAMAKSFDFSGETALVLGKKGNLYIIL